MSVERDRGVRPCVCCRHCVQSGRYPCFVPVPSQPDGRQIADRIARHSALNDLPPRWAASNCDRVASTSFDAQVSGLLRMRTCRSVGGLEVPVFGARGLAMWPTISTWPRSIISCTFDKRCLPATERWTGRQATAKDGVELIGFAERPGLRPC